MGLEELFALPFILTATEGLADAAVSSGVWLAADAAASAAVDAAVVVGTEAAIGAAVDVGAAAVVDSVAAAIPEVAGEVAAATIPEVVAPALEAIPEAVTPLTELGAAESWPLASGVISTPVETAEDILAQSVALEGSGGNLAEAMASSSEVWGTESPWGTVLSSLTKMVPGADALFSSMAEGSLNVPAMFQVLTALFKLMGPIGPGIGRFLQMHTLTAEKHIPALLGTAQMLLGKMTQNPTTNDHGIVFSSANIKSALDVMGVRFSDEEELADSWLVEPIGNVIDLNAKADRLLYTENAAAVIGSVKDVAGTIGNLLDPERYPFLKTLMDQGITMSSLAEAISADVAASRRNYEEGKAQMATWWDKSSGQSIADSIFKVIVAILAMAVDSISTVIDVCHDKIGDAIEPIMRKTITDITTQIAGEEPVTPEMAIGRAAAAFDSAMGMGIKAHALAAAAEMFHPAKELGFPQLAAGMADLGAFQPVFANSTAVWARAAVGRPSQWASNKQTRSNLPDVRAWVDAYTRGFIGPDELTVRLQYEGWPEWAIRTFLPVPFRRPSPRDLAAIFEDEQADSEWIYQTLQRGGYHPDDIDKMVSGLLARSQKSAKQALISQAVTCYADGLIDDAGLTDALTMTGMRTETQPLVLRRAQLYRVVHIASQLTASYRTLAVDQVISPDDFKTSLQAIGITEDVASAEMAVVQAKVTGTLFKAEAAAVKAEVRKQQALLVESLDKQVRLGTVDPLTMQAELVAAGFTDETATAMAQLAGLKALPVPTLEKVYSLEAIDQQQTAYAVETVLAYVQKGNLDALTATAALVSLGLDLTTATDRILLAQARGWKAPAIVKPPVEDPAVRQAREIRTQAAIAAFRGSEITTDELRQELTLSGVAGVVVDAIVERELVKSQIAADKVLAQLAAQIEKDALTAAKAGA